MRIFLDTMTLKIAKHTIRYWGRMLGECGMIQLKSIYMGQ